MALAYGCDRGDDHTEHVADSNFRICCGRLQQVITDLSHPVSSG